MGFEECLLKDCLRFIIVTGQKNNNNNNNWSTIGRGADLLFNCGTAMVLLIQLSLQQTRDAAPGAMPLGQCPAHICTHVTFQNLMRSCTILHLVG